jgi:hypothetical protein
MKPVKKEQAPLARSSSIFFMAFMTLMFLHGVLWAQTPANPYRPNPADEDWTFLKTAQKSDFWDPVKYIALGREDWSLTLGGELRWRGEGLRIRPSGGRPSLTDNYQLQRYLFSGDARLGKQVRLFGELQSGILTGKLRSPRPTDRNRLDLHQAFVEWRRLKANADGVKIAVGRQEIELGTSRLISASPGLNVKRAFDGVVGSYRGGPWRIAAVAASLITLDAGAFDDRSDVQQLFWGAAAARSGSTLTRSVLGGYYLGIDRDPSSFVQGIGRETRHTFGAHLETTGSRFEFNYDALLQWGHFEGAPIRAWAFATETGFRFPKTPWTPRVSLRSDFASGDRDQSAPALQSFNPLFPGNAYSGAVGLLGPTNLTDFTPAVTLTPRRGLVIGFEAPSYWRTSLADGVYATDLRVLIPPQAGTGRYVGTNPAGLVVWRATRHLEIQGVITRFLAGAFLERTFVADGFGFYSMTARYRF